jgi:4-hydroxy-tetrahydrodipicolinate reductase
MTKVAVSGAAGRMGRMVAETIHAAPDFELVALYDPEYVGVTVAEMSVSGDPSVMATAEVVVEFTNPTVVLDNLVEWRRLGINAVVGTSGFDESRLGQLAERWGSGPPNCLVVPNFSIGAVVMMRLSELAAAHFDAAEVIELHHDRKVDAPSGTALATARRIAATKDQHRAVESAELVPGARGADVDTVPVHSIRLPGYVAHQEVVFGGLGETLSIRHDTTDRQAFMPGVLLAIREVGDLPTPLSVGLEPLLGM